MNCSATTIMLIGIVLITTITVTGVDTDTSSNRFPKPISGFGVVTHFVSTSRGWHVDQLIEPMRQMGVSYVRDEIKWAYIEKTKGEYRIPKKISRWVKPVLGAGIDIIALLDYGNKLYDNPLDPIAFSKYASFIAQSYKGKIHVFEIWNEPHNFLFRKQYGGSWNGKGDCLWLAKFAELTDAASRAIRKVNPDAIIIGGTDNPASTAHLVNQYGNRLRELDGLTIHPYAYRLPPEITAWGGPKITKRDGVAVADDDHSYGSLLEHIMNRYASKLQKARSLWLTEVGYTTYNQYYKPKMYYGFTRQTQAAYLVRLVIQSLAKKVAAVTIYDLKDDGKNIFDAEHNFGLLDWHSNPKPSGKAFMRLATYLGGGHEIIDAPPAKLEPILNQPSAIIAWEPKPVVKVSDVKCQWFKTKQGLLTILWKAGRYHVEVNLPFVRFIWPGYIGRMKFEAVDVITGQTTTFGGTRKDGTLTTDNLQLSSNPQLILWPTK